jgi:cellulose synthase/poly-beta-1,6-N-acetylglucosamine synthase-like glycosyltransferase
MMEDIFWWILYVVDWTLFVIVTLTVAYMLFFSLVSLISKNHNVPKAKNQNRFIILIPSYKNDQVIIQTVASILSQNYPQRMFDVVVISDHQSEITNMRLAQYTITLLTPDFEKSSKTKSLQYAILNLPEFKIYDVAIILNADDLVEPEFLDQMNDAYEAAGTKAIVAHKLPRNRDTSSARLSTIFDEINNNIFRRAHINVGLSSALMGSGVAYEFNWFKKHIMKVRTATEDKELEAMLMHQRYYVDYFDNIYLYNVKKREVADFNKQRGRWITDQIRSLAKNIRFLPVAIFRKQYDWVDKIIQWMLLPRSIMSAIIFVMSLTLPFIYLTIAIKWWVVTGIWGFSLAIATPNELVDKNWDKDFITLPLVTLKNISKMIIGHIKKK